MRHRPTLLALAVIGLAAICVLPILAGGMGLLVVSLMPDALEGYTSSMGMDSYFIIFGLLFLVALLASVMLTLPRSRR